MRSVVICGSRRFKPEIREFAQVLREKGVIVFEPYLHSGKPGIWDQLPAEYKKYILLGLTHDHLHKIRMADVIYIYNKDGYMGASVTLELGAAVALNKPVYAYSDEEPELARLVLIRDIIETPEKLITKL